MPKVVSSIIWIGKKLMKNVFAALFLVIQAYCGYAQSVYTYDIKKDIALGTLSLGIGLSPFFANNTPEQTPALLNKNDINGFDRSLMFPYNETVDIISNYGVYGLLVLPAVSVMWHRRDKNALLTYAIMYSEVFLLTFGTKELLKKLIIRFRPYMYETGLPGGKEYDYYNSFPSGSSAYAFLGAAFLSAAFLQEYPASKLKLPVIIGSYALASGIASMRIISGSHFLSDVLTGVAIGSFYGWIIPFLHKKQSNETGLAINFTGNGLLVSLKLQS
jgi:membrane-associated phospholipid phosphatase